MDIRSFLVSLHRYGPLAHSILPFTLAKKRQMLMLLSHMQSSLQQLQAVSSAGVKTQIVITLICELTRPTTG
ncbi:hypothetical protein H0H81_008410 [Sphagnurus paluster]|uniref:Uncharacterized protein n=1 Tax=Sphagnurus paluster TaxID=117069 RepID=A0A9P7K344_9AGAR|nr:hypothetical protein H0H81_008410 [Sphagnurus paluster]